ncbi:MAG TPA: GrpB family protein [Saprospiraceae bacterium]|nr:GrpB family protein [Saprospiraceae bacterium]
MLLAKYTSDWITQFQIIKAKIENVLGVVDTYTIQHVGSTSVPLLDAKPIIDIDIIYHTPDDFEIIKSGLEKLGYDHHGNQGIADREVFKRNQNYMDDILDTIQHHLYVCPLNSAALERHLLTRDFMRKNEWARLQYQELKFEMAARANQDRKTYQALKEAHINSFLDLMVEKEKIEKENIRLL